MANKFLTKLRALEGAVNPEAEHPGVLQTPSPSVNWALKNDAYGVKNHGLPFGAGMLLYGPPKGGKSIITNALVGQLHRQDPEAIAIKFNTEMRGAMQDNSAQHKMWGIDPDRFVVFDANAPENIFDRIETDIGAMVQEGAKIKLIIIDSLTGISGRRTQNATTILTQQIGDHAATIKDGLGRIMTTIRKHGIALICTSHIRAELDQLEQMRGNTVKMQGAWATKHFFEFFCYVEPNRSKTGKTTLAGEDFTDSEVVDFMDKAQKTGHKIRFTLKESSLGPSGRTAEFTLDYEKGIVNTYEEIFTLAVNMGILTRPNNQTYEYKDLKWRGLVNCLSAIRDSDTLQQQLLLEVFKKDC